MKQLILASQSPRRQELLGRLDLPFLVCPAQGEEIIDPTLSPPDLVAQLAQQKAEEILATHPDAVVIGSDTMVVLGDRILGKPKDEGEAFAMITALQGKTHQVFTGVALLSAQKKTVFSQEAKVTMCPLTPEQVQYYIDQGESLDKAGGYGIQGIGACFIQGIEGDFFNVMGLPLCAVTQALGEFGLGVFAKEEHKGGCS